MRLLKLISGILGAVFPFGRRAVSPPAPTKESPPITAIDSDTLGVGVPQHWPPRHNVNMEPCDMTDGPCCCGAWHDHDEEWVRNGVEWFGARPVASA